VRRHWADAEAVKVATLLSMPTRTQQLGLLMLLAALVVYVFIRVL
jgi:hypothetical protein